MVLPPKRSARNALATAMRLMSFAMTIDQFLDGSKNVTRRIGWRFLKQGDQVRAVEKAMGLKKGERPVTLGIIEVVSVYRTPLVAITWDDVRREGFPEMTPHEFVAMFCLAMKCEPCAEVTRIEFRRVEN